jgi:hypothetical protein
LVLKSFDIEAVNHQTRDHPTQQIPEFLAVKKEEENN